MSFSRVAIIGLGLIGSSVARAARANMPGIHITAFDTDAGTLRIARELKLADICTTSAAEAMRGAELVVLAVPVAALASAAEAIIPHLPPGAVITDVASVKRPLLTLFPPASLVVPAHPIAGSEKTGAGAGTAELFKGKPVILTPPNPEAPEVQPVAEFWKALGAKVVFMPPELHDRIYACVSHLPQYLSFEIKELYNVFHVEQKNNILKQFLRLSGSGEALWSGIFAANADNIRHWLDIYLDVLHQMRSELREGQGDAAPDNALVYGELFPRIAAGCMVHVALRAERELGVSLKPYAGTGFADFAAPASAPPEADMERISAQSHAVAKLADDFALLLERRRFII